MMVWRFFKTLCITVFTLGLATGYPANASQLRDAIVSSENYSVDAVLDFDAPVSSDKVDIQFINQTVQIDIPGGTVPEGKLRKTIGSRDVRSLYTYQLNDKVLRTRIIYEKPIQANMFEGFVHVASVGNQIKIRVEDPQSKMSASKLKPKSITLTPPIDIEAELQPKEFQQVKREASAASVLENEFLTKIDKFSDEVGPVKLAKNATKPVAKAKKPLIVATASDKRVIDTNEQEPKKLAESEIPLNLGAKEKTAKVETPWMRLIISFIVISLVGIGTIIFTKKFSKSNSRVGGNIKIQTISQQSLGPKKSLAVIRVAGEDILIGITDYNISMIKSLSFIDDEVTEVPQKFVSELDKVTDDFISTKTSQRSTNAPAQAYVDKKSQEVGDQYSYANIKDIVSDKLKEMRPL